MLSEVELAYIAGIVDGEGCISMYRQNTTYFPRLNVVNTNRDLAEYLKKRLGGVIMERKRVKLCWKDSYEWQVQHQKAIDTVRMLLPYLLLKKEQALVFVALDIVRQIGRKDGHKFKGRFTPEAKGVFQMIIDRLHELNRKGKELAPKGGG